MEQIEVRHGKLRCNKRKTHKVHPLVHPLGTTHVACHPVPVALGCLLLVCRSAGLVYQQAFEQLSQ